MCISCIIIEDEPLALERVKGYVEKLPFLHLLASFDNALDALTYLRSMPVDLLFLDINIGELSGIQLLEAVDLKAEVIITTAYNEFALKGFELNVTDYLLKPFSFERFLQAVSRVQKNFYRNENATEKKFFFVKTEHRLEKILFSELLYVEGMRDYRCIYTLQKRIMTLQTFSELEQSVPSNILCRVHKSYMVAPDKIDLIERDRIRIGDKIIPISETYRQGFYGFINSAVK